MLNYENFKEVMRKRLMNHMPPGYQKGKIIEDMIYKNGQKLDAFSYCCSEKDKIKPTMYYNWLYEEYQNGSPLENLLGRVAGNLWKRMKRYRKTL